MKKVLIVLVTILAFNLSNGQEIDIKGEYKMKFLVTDTYTLGVKGTVTITDSLAILDFKMKKMDDIVFKLNTPKQHSDDIIVYQTTEGSQRKTLTYSTALKGVFTIDSKDEFTDKTFSTSITFK